MRGREGIIAQKPRGKGRGGDTPEGSANGGDLDAFDEKIIECLRVDGRISVREIGAIIGLNEATVRSRMRRLDESAAMRVVAMIDLAALGYKFVAPVGVQVRGRAVEEVGRDLAAIEQVLSVTSSVGVRDLEIQLIAKTNEELSDLLIRRLPEIRGIAKLEASLALDVRKYESPWVPLL